jgi:hypothetical protein
MKLRADKIMEEAAATFRERNKMYGDNWKVVGRVMKALFPKGMKLATETDFVKLHLIDWMVGKLSRLAFSKLTHIDSIHDLVVYGAMLEAVMRGELVKPEPGFPRFKPVLRSEKGMMLTSDEVDQNFIDVHKMINELIERNGYGSEGSSEQKLPGGDKKPARREGKANLPKNNHDRRRKAKVNRRSDKAPRGKRRSHRHSAPVRRSRKT